MPDHDRSLELEIFHQFCLELDIIAGPISDIQLSGFFSDERSQFHRFTEWIDTGVCYLAGIQHNPVKDDRIIPGIAHSTGDDLS